MWPASASRPPLLASYLPPGSRCLGGRCSAQGGLLGLHCACALSAGCGSPLVLRLRCSGFLSAAGPSCAMLPLWGLLAAGICHCAGLVCGLLPNLATAAAAAAPGRKRPCAGLGGSGPGLCTAQEPRGRVAKFGEACSSALWRLMRDNREDALAGRAMRLGSCAESGK